MQPTREEIENSQNAGIVSPYAGKNRPKQRGFADILGDEPEDDTHAAEQNRSPAKSGQGKNYQPMRIFEAHEEAPEEDTPKGNRNSYIRPNPRKYQHFDFADGSDPNDAPQAGVDFDKRPKSKHDSQWSFDDFVTPQKAKPTKAVRAQEVRHWDTDKEALGDETPAHPAMKARRDAETHFELQDDGERIDRPDRPNTRAPGSTHNDNLGLYKNKLFDQEEEAPESQRPLGNITNLKDRGKTFEAHWEMTDDSPAPAQRQEPVPEHRKKAVKMMDANWSSYDESPTQKENTRLGKPQDDTRIHIAGDGMGGKKGTNRNWLYGGGDDEEEAPKPTTTRRAGGLTSQQRSFWDF